MNATTTITYDRRRREYLLAGEIGEEIAAFPAGKEGKLAAQTAQLEIIAPAALALARRAVASYPVLVGRALRAAQIVAAGGVRDGLPHAWHVDSQSKEPTYTVSSGGYHAWHCTCPDWRRGWLGEPRSAPTLQTREQRQVITCKHILAVMFHLDLADARANAWPPACPECSGAMNIRRQRNNGSGRPFWSCRKFPACRGRRDFAAHPDDVAQGSDETQARYLSLDRAKAAGLLVISANGRQRQRALEDARHQAEVQRRERETALPVQPRRGKPRMYK